MFNKIKYARSISLKLMLLLCRGKLIIYLKILDFS
jgi:hypothetical protein